MTCKDCLHYEVCKDDLSDSELNREMTEDCHCCYFKDKSKFIELPCKVGDTVFVVDEVMNNIYSTTLINVRIGDLKNTFITLDEAEAKLKELNEL